MSRIANTLIKIPVDVRVSLDGVNISIEKSGTIRVGDRVRYEPSERSLMYQKYQALSAKVRNQAIQSSFKLIDKLTKQK